MMARAGSRSTFKEGRDDLKIYAGIEVSAKDIERVAEGMGQQMEAWASEERREILRDHQLLRSEKTIPILYISYDGTGVPMTQEELTGRKGKQVDGSAKTREAKLGWDFGWRIYGEAARRGLSKAERVVVLADGAQWIKNLAQMHFPEATLIIDLYHARQHVSELCKTLFVRNEKKVRQQRMCWWTDLDDGKVEKIVRQARQHLTQDAEAKKKAEIEIHYLEKNAEYMRYAGFRAQGLFVGSGVVEAACKTLIGQRLKQSGMEWSVRGANAIISLRCILTSGRFEDYWESRAL
jgi:hypothetical protein